MKERLFLNSNPTQSIVKKAQKDARAFCSILVVVCEVKLLLLLNRINVKPLNESRVKTEAGPGRGAI